MNTYEIFFTRENGTTGSDRFTAPDEKQARKDFRECYRHSTGTITEVKLVSENVPASKEQERKALESIRAIIATLGPNSYLATAFEGCFEIAEENINNDFADSMKDRWLTADRKLNEAHGIIEELRDKLAESEKDYEAAHAAAHEIAEEKDAEIAALRARILSDDDLCDLSQVLSERRFTLDEEVKNAAERIVEAAGEPDSAAFKNAVLDHRAAKASLDYYNALTTRLAKTRQAITAGA